ncbi:MAG: hypothetical protein D6725_09050 [Planctomycetota bacterium]|nr:MAG: hypothetical protein D6725_09050 [Planctomycetota bacterium]
MEPRSSSFRGKGPHRRFLRRLRTSRSTGQWPWIAENVIRAAFWVKGAREIGVPAAEGCHANTLRADSVFWPPNSHRSALGIACLDISPMSDGERCLSHGEATLLARDGSRGCKSMRARVWIPKRVWSRCETARRGRAPRIVRRVPQPRRSERAVEPRALVAVRPAGLVQMSFAISGRRASTCEE